MDYSTSITQPVDSGSMAKYDECSDEVKELIKKHLECKSHFMEYDKSMSFSYKLQQ